MNLCNQCGRFKSTCGCAMIKLDLPEVPPKTGPLIVREVIPGKFHRNHSATNDLVNEIKAVIYSKTGVLSVAEVLGVLRVVEHDILQEQS